MKLNDIARLFGYTGQQIRNLVDQGFIPKPTGKKLGKQGNANDYDLQATAVGLVSYLKKRIQDGEGARSALAQSRAGVAEEDRKWKEQRRLEKGKQLVPIKNVELVWDARKAAVRQIIEQLPISKKQKDDVLEELVVSNAGEYFK